MFGACRAQAIWAWIRHGPPHPHQAQSSQGKEGEGGGRDKGFEGKALVFDMVAMLVKMETLGVVLVKRLV